MTIKIRLNSGKNFSQISVLAARTKVNRPILITLPTKNILLSLNLLKKHYFFLISAFQKISATEMGRSAPERQPQVTHRFYRCTRHKYTSVKRPTLPSLQQPLPFTTLQKQKLRNFYKIILYFSCRRKSKKIS